jgi:tetratricopeptide (TPR) repeat protein
MRWGPVLLTVAVVGAGLGGAAGELGVPGAVAGVIAAVTALLSGAFVGYYFPARDQQKAALEARDQVLDALRVDGVPLGAGDAAADPLALLQADRSPMPFRGRGREMRQLNEWLAGVKASPVMLLSGSAGVGKSRLALEFASRAPAEWAVGWLRARTGATAVGVMAAGRQSTLVLVDDADGRDDLGPLLDDLAERQGDPSIRVVLVTRGADGFRASLLTSVEERHAKIVSGAPVIEVMPIGGADDRARWFGEAVHAFATVLARPEPALAEVFPQGRAEAAQPFVLIQAQALLAVIGTEGDPRRLTFDEVARALMRHEKRRWNALAEARTWGSGGPPAEPVRERAVTALALLGADSDAEAEEVLRRVPQLRDATAERRYEIASWVLALYPAEPGAAPRIRPDLIGEWFVISQLTGNPELTEALRVKLTDDQAAQALGFIARAADRIESAAPLFADFAAGDVTRLTLAAAEAAMTGESGHQLLDVVVAGQVAATGSWSVDQLAELDRLIPGNVLLRTQAVIADRLVESLRSLAADNPDGYRHACASALDKLTTVLGELGRHNEAMVPAVDAVVTWRVLAADARAAHRAGLGGALGALASCLGRLGRIDEALELAEESVAVFRGLGAGSPATYQAELAAGLASAGRLLAELARHREGAAVGTEAVSIYRGLAEDEPAAYQAGLASSLHHLGTCLFRLGRQREALDCIEESLALYCSLAADNPVIHQVALAIVMADLGTLLDELRRYGEALKATEDSIAIFRPLAAENAAFWPNLAMALNNRGNHLDRLARPREALAASEESVALYRRLMPDNPAAHQANLALALDNLGVRYLRDDRLDQALTVAEESVAIRRAQAEEQPAYRANLGSSLHNLGALLSKNGKHQTALKTTRESVDIYRILAEGNPDVHEADLALALHNLGACLEDSRRDRDALAAWAESVRLYGRLAARDPERYRDEHRRRHGGLSKKYELRGLQYEAITHGLETRGPMEK